MNVLGKVRAIERLFKTLENEIQKLQLQTGIHCVENCIKCCTTPRIEATALEFYPLAYHLYKTGQAENFLAKIEQINSPSVCPALNNLTLDGTRPGCSHYAYRGLICRLFTYNYSTDKYGLRRISACKTIRLNQARQLDMANEILLNKPLGPKASDYYSQLQSIDFHEAHMLYPIGEAIKTAVEKILNDAYYRGNKAI